MGSVAACTHAAIGAHVSRRRGPRSTPLATGRAGCAHASRRRRCFPSPPSMRWTFFFCTFSPLVPVCTPCPDLSFTPCHPISSVLPHSVLLCRHVICWSHSSCVVSFANNQTIKIKKKKKKKKKS